MFQALKRLLIGSPIATSEEHHQRLRKLVALPVFASDPISSTAYATEEILLVLVPVAAAGAFNYVIPIAIVVAILLLIVVTSYRQTILAYPGGGGTYIVSRDNLGTNPSLVAGAAILVDYVLTVAVSVSAGVAAITSAVEPLRPYRVEVCLAAVALMTIANLRGVKESGALFAPPTYVYIFSFAGLVGYGLYRVFLGGLGEIPGQEEALAELVEDPALITGATFFILMRAFSSGAVALSGIEAVADGVPAFRRPESRNAAITITVMGAMLASLFFGASVLAQHLKPIPQEGGETVISIMGRHVFGDGNPIYFVLQFATFAILILAANTAYADFPRLSGFVARDGFLPRQLTNRGDRLVFSNGIVVLATVAGALIVAFNAEVSALIPLYAVGVFTAFTLSQSGMVMRHRQRREKGWRPRVVMNAVGATATGLVLAVVIVSKFAIGAWIPVVVIPSLVLVFKMINRHYRRVSRVVEIRPGWRPRRYEHFVVVAVGTVNKAVLNAITYARSLAPDRLVAVSVVGDAEEQEALQRAWAEHDIPVELHTIYSPYRELTEPFLRYLDELDAESDDDIITVVIPEFVTSMGTQWLHNQSALGLKLALLYRPHTVVTSVPIHVDVDTGEVDEPTGRTVTDVSARPSPPAGS
ncbi:MAG: APC family permease [Acidimicrobiales bacterium]